MKVKWIILILILFYSAIIYFGVSANTNSANFSFNCDSMDSKDCYGSNNYFSADSGITHQVFQGSWNTHANQKFGNSSYLRVQACLTQSGWGLGNQAGCVTSVDENIYYTGAYDWAGSTYIDLGYLDDLNYLSFHVWVNNTYSTTSGTVEGRRVSIDSFNVPATATVGTPFTISWTTNQGVNNANLYFDSSRLSCNTLGGPVSGGQVYNGSSSTTCTPTAAGTGWIRLDAYGPDGNGPITINSQRNVPISDPTPNCNANAYCNNSSTTPNSCSSNNLHYYNCYYRVYNGSTNCIQVPAPDAYYTVNNCTSPYYVCEPSVPGTCNPAPFNLSVNSSGGPTGVGITGSPAGSTPYNATVRYNSSVSLTAPPQGGYTFSGWTGVSGCGASVTCSFTMPAANVSATANYYGTGTINVTSNVATSWSIAGPTPISGTGTSGTYSATTGSYTITPAPLSNNVYSVNPSVTQTLTAGGGITFNIVYTPTYTLTVTKTGTGTGTVSSSPAGINCGPSCPNQSYVFTSGQTITLTNAPSSGSGFAGWSGGCSGTGSCVFTITADRTVNADFQLMPTVNLSCQVL